MVGGQTCKPSAADERFAHAYAEVIHLSSEGMVTREDALGEFYAYISQVRRDAAREALDSYIEYGVKHAQKWSTPTDVGHFRDTHYPGDVAP